MAYNFFKFLHIVAIVVWIGGVVAVGVLNARFARREAASVLAAVARQSRFVGAFVIGPAALTALVAGIVMMYVSHVGFTLWIVWGIVAMILSIALGATVLRRAGTQLSERVAAADSGDPHVALLERRLALWSAVNIVVLLSAIWVMVFKPIV